MCIYTHKLFYEKANEIKVGFKGKSTILKDGEGSLITDKKKAAEEFKDMFSKILNQPFQIDLEKNNSTVEQGVDDPTIDEVEQAVNMLKNGKAPEDAVIAELLEGEKKPNGTAKMASKYYMGKRRNTNKMARVNAMPNSQKRKHMVCQNYRGISLLSTVYKIVSNIILN